MWLRTLKILHAGNMKFQSVITRSIFILLIGLFLCIPSELLSQQQWYKGNIHTHTTNSDGDSPPNVVVKWYKDNNYNFLVITDHNHLTPVADLDTSGTDDFLLIPGIEVTDSYRGTPVHVLAIGAHQDIQPQHGVGVTETLQNNIDAIREAGSIPVIAHPRWRWAFGAEEMCQVTRCSLFEIFNPGCNYFSGGGAPGCEETWDEVLSQGVLMYGVGVDDMHNLSRGTGLSWVMVNADTLSEESILRALEQGSFYATTGVLLESYTVSNAQIEVVISPTKYGKYTTEFIGYRGNVLKKDISLNPRYTFTGDEKYVRVCIMDSNGKMAWLQPIPGKNFKQ